MILFKFLVLFFIIYNPSHSNSSERGHAFPLCIAFPLPDPWASTWSCLYSPLSLLSAPGLGGGWPAGSEGTRGLSKDLGYPAACFSRPLTGLSSLLSKVKTRFGTCASYQCAQNIPSSVGWDVLVHWSQKRQIYFLKQNFLKYLLSSTVGHHPLLLTQQQALKWWPGTVPACSRAEGISAVPLSLRHRKPDGRLVCTVCSFTCPGCKGALFWCPLFGLCSGKNFLFEWQVILLVEWQFPQVLAFVFGGVDSFWEMVLCMFGEEMIYWEVTYCSWLWGLFPLPGSGMSPTHGGGHCSWLYDKW